jgi:Protein of unknown function (DUF1236)
MNQGRGARAGTATEETMQFKTFAAAAALVASLAAPAFAQTMTTTTTETTRTFGAPEREVITKYYTTHRDLVPTTTTVTTVQRGAALPTTVTTRELPADLVAQLPPLSVPTYRRVLVGNQVVLVDNRNMVIDVLPLGS